MKNLIRDLQLAVSAEEHRLDARPIDESRLPEIEQARKRLGLLRAGDVIAGLIAMRRNGLSLTLDLKPPYSQTTETPPARASGAPARNFAGIATKARP